MINSRLSFIAAAVLKASAVKLAAAPFTYPVPAARNLDHVTTHDRATLRAEGIHYRSLITVSQTTETWELSDASEEHIVNA